MLWKCLDFLDIDSNNMIYVSFVIVFVIFLMLKFKKFNVCCNNNKNFMLGNSLYCVLGNDYFFVNIILLKNLEVLDCFGNYVYNVLRWIINLLLIGEKL